MRTSTRYGPPLANARPIAGAMSGAFSTRSPGTPSARALRGGDRLVHDHGVRRRAPRELVDERERLDRYPRSLRLGAPRELCALALPGGAHRAPAPGRVRVALFAREAPDRLAELGERRLGVALDRHGGGVVLAELPWVDVEMDDRDSRRHRVHVVGQRERKEVAAHREEPD